MDAASWCGACGRISSEVMPWAGIWRSGAGDGSARLVQRKFLAHSNFGRRAPCLDVTRDGGWISTPLLQRRVTRQNQEQTGCPGEGAQLLANPARKFKLCRPLAGAPAAVECCPLWGPRAETVRAPSDGMDSGRTFDIGSKNIVGFMVRTDWVRGDYDLSERCAQDTGAGFGEDSGGWRRIAL